MPSRLMDTDMDPDAMSTTSSISSDLGEESHGGVYGACRPLLGISRALGVLPAQAARVEQMVKEPALPYRPNRNTRIYSALLYLLAMTLGGLSIYYRCNAMSTIFDEARDKGEGSSENVQLYFKLAYTLFTMLFCLLYAIFSRFAGDTYAGVFSALDSVDESFRFTDHNAASKRSIRHLLFASLVLPLAAFDIYVLSNEFIVTNSPTVAYLGFSTHIFALVTNVIVEQQFMSFCLALRERFEHLNLHLISLQPLVFPIQDTDLKYKNSDLSLSDQLYAIARSEFADVIKYNKHDTGIFRARGVSPMSYAKPAWGVDTTGSPLTPAPQRTNEVQGPVTLKARLALLRRVHDSLCDIMGQINGMYGACLLASISFIFCGVLSLSYHIVTKALYPQPGGDSSVIITLVQAILWLLYLSARLIAITWACASTTKEAQRAGPLHQKLTKRTLDASTKEELHLFSTQLLQRDIGFSVCGLFPLDFTLLYTVAGAVTTYLVILIQFQSVQPPKASNSTITTIKPNVVTQKP